MGSGENKSLEVLADHYKDTFTQITSSESLRGRLLLGMLLLVSLILFRQFAPSVSSQVVSQIMSKSLGIVATIDVSFLSSLIWFALLGFALRYFQVVVRIDRLYKYIHKLEDQLNPMVDGIAFTREGRSYLKDYPLFSKWTAFVYRIALPLILMMVVIIGIRAEWNPILPFDLTYWAGGLAGICTVVSTLLYLIQIHLKK